MVKGFSVVNEADVFLEFPCFLYDPMKAGNLIYSSCWNSPALTRSWSYPQSAFSVSPKICLVVRSWQCCLINFLYLTSPLLLYWSCLISDTLFVPGWLKYSSNWSLCIEESTYPSPLCHRMILLNISHIVLLFSMKHFKDCRGPIYWPWYTQPFITWSSFMFYFCPFMFISWRLITLQYCSGFCHTLTWISNGFTCILHPDPPSHLSLRPIPLGLPSVPGLSTCLMHPTRAGDLFHPR